jgi:uncharacterized membrane protein HdeD (DUF308 family)
MSTVLAHNWWAIALRGVLGIIFGLIAFYLPGATILSLVLLFAAYAVVDGVFAIVSAIRAARQGERWALLVLEGIAGLLVGAISVLLPGLTAVTFVLVLACWAIVSGSLMVFAAFNLDIEHGRWWLVLGGAASVIFGVLLFGAPLLGVIVVAWWLGAYAFVFGVILLILAFKLWAHRHDPPPAMAQRAT